MENDPYNPTGDKRVVTSRDRILSITLEVISLASDIPFKQWGHSYEHKTQ